MSDPYRTVMGRSISIPAFQKGTHADGKTITAVGVADVEDGTGDGLAFGDQELESAPPVFDD